MYRSETVGYYQSKTNKTLTYGDIILVELQTCLQHGVILANKFASPLPDDVIYLFLSTTEVDTYMMDRFARVSKSFCIASAFDLV